jgi:hypothetical protein
MAGPDAPTAATDLVDHIAAELAARAEPDRAGPMARYMRDQFPFLGVTAAGQRAAWRAATASVPRRLPEPEVVEAALALWRRRPQSPRGADVARTPPASPRGRLRPRWLGGDRRA